MTVGNINSPRRKALRDIVAHAVSVDTFVSLQCMHFGDVKHLRPHVRAESTNPVSETLQRVENREKGVIATQVS